LTAKENPDGRDVGAPQEIADRSSKGYDQAGQMSTLEHALDLAARGFWVFPVLPKGHTYKDRNDKEQVSDGKHPAVTGWQKWATTDPGRITRFWTRNPGYNIGISTSVFGADGGCALVAVDVDTKKGKKGLVSLAAVDMEFGLPDTLSHSTPSGGKHLLYLCDVPLKQGTDVLGEGLDIRSRGGFIVAPGSRIGGVAYERLPGPSTPTEAPEWLVSRLNDGRQAPEAKDREPLQGVDPDRAEDRAHRYLCTAPVAVQDQGGDTQTFKVAAKVKDHGVPESLALALMLEHWNPRCEPPWEVDDLAVKVHNAFAHGQNPPGTAAPEAVFPDDLTPEPSADVPPSHTKHGKPRRLELLTWNAIKDLPTPPPDWVWRPFLPRVAFAIVAAQSGHGKSLLGLQLAVATATGLPLFGLPTCGPSGVGVVALEDDRNVVIRRLQAVKDSYGLDWTPEHDSLMASNLRIMVRSKAALGTGEAAAHTLAGLVDEIGEELATTGRPALLILDTLNSMNGADENSNDAVRELVATIFRLHDALGCTVVATHHLRKSGTGRNAPTLGDRMDAELVRGASALVASARAVVQFGWITPKEAEKVGLFPENADRRYAILCLSKINDGPRPSPVLLEHGGRVGLWHPVPDGDSILAGLRGEGAERELESYEAILLDIAAGLDHAALATKHFPDDPRGAAGKLKSSLTRMRSTKGWLQPRTIVLTLEGAKKVAELRGCIAGAGCNPDYEETKLAVDFD
jgi:hypothetical protein